MYDEIVFEDGIISLGGEEVPGILRSLSVSGQVRFDEQKVDGASGKKKTPVGFEDCDISISLYLITDDDSNCYEKLEKLAGMFGKTDEKANPQVYEVMNRHIFLRGIRQVVFSKLSTSENDKSDEIIATLGFVEHNPPIVKTEKAQAKTPTPGELAQKAVQAAVNAVTGQGGGQGGENRPQEDSMIIELG